MIKRILLFAGFYIVLLFASAQPGSVDLTFNPGASIGTSGSYGFGINTLALQNDGKIIIGGSFTTYQGFNSQSLARLLPDGSFDTSFHSGFVLGSAEVVYSLALQTDGKIIAGGALSFYDSLPFSEIVRLNSDGSIDTSFHTGTGFTTEVYSLLIQADGKILVGGVFTGYNGTSAGNIIRLDPDGTVDNTFSAVPGATGSVQAITLQSDGKIVIGGDFTSYNGDTLYRIARLNPNGSGDAGFNHLGIFDKVVYALALTGDTQTIAGGHFTSFDFQSRSLLAEINNYGNLTQFNNASHGATDGTGTIFDLKLIGNNELLVAGNFTSFNNSGSGLALLDTTATLNPLFNTGTGVDGQLMKTAIQADGKILIAGIFSGYNGMSINSIARIYNCFTPQPGPISGDTLVSCPGTILNYSINPVYGASSYTWSLPSGWSGSSDSTSISVIAGDTSGVISVVAFGDSCGNSIPQTLNVQVIPAPSIPVCLVTVDSQSKYNIVIWDKPQTSLIDSFFIYRQDSTYLFTKIASVPYDSLSEYDDTTSAANPNSTSHQYKLSVLDNCGIESVLSDFHSTIFLQNLGNGNLLWAPYQIENAVNPVIYYRVYRDTSGSGDFVPLNTIIPGGNTSYTDVDAAQYPNAQYVLDVNWGISCTPTRAVSTSRSNIRGKPKSLDEIGVLMEQDFTIFPNPANKTVMLSYPASAKVNSIEIESMMGEVVYSVANAVPESYLAPKQINVGNMAKGVYIVSLSTCAGRIMKKLVIQ